MNKRGTYYRIHCNDVGLEPVELRPTDEVYYQKGRLSASKFATLFEAQAVIAALVADPGHIVPALGR